MVCIYCGWQTRVINSRLQKRRNAIWRRRRCEHCGAVFSSLEHAALESNLAASDGQSHIVPFQRDALFLSLYEACRHRQSAVSDAAALTDTVLAKLIPSQVVRGSIDRKVIALTASAVLKQFDAAAYTHYLAFHPLQH